MPGYRGHFTHPAYSRSRILRHEDPALQCRANKNKVPLGLRRNAPVMSRGCVARLSRGRARLGGRYSRYIGTFPRVVRRTCRVSAGCFSSPPLRTTDTTLPTTPLTVRGKPVLSALQSTSACEPWAEAHGSRDPIIRSHNSQLITHNFAITPSSTPPACL